MRITQWIHADAFSQLGYEAYRKLQGEFLDFETGEILKFRKMERSDV